MSHDEALALARGELAWWVPWWPLLSALGAWLYARAVGALAARVALARVRRVAPDAHWTLRAREATTARSITSSALAAGIAAGAFLCTGGLVSVLSGTSALALGVVAGALGVVPGRRRLDDALGLPRARHGARGAVVVWLALLAVIPFTLVAGLIVARVDDPVSAFLAWLLGGALLAGWTRGASFRVVDWLGVSLPVPSRVTAAVDRAAAKLGMRPPPTLVVDVRLANAWAFPMAGRLAFSAPAIDALSDDALEAVVLHELGHLREPPAVLAFRALRLASVYALALVPLASRFDPVGPFVLVGAVVVFALAARRASVRFEEAADRVAHVHADEGAYALALERLHEANLMPAVTRVRATHPHLYDRLAAAGATPSYPRPAPPDAGLGPRTAIAVVALGVALAARVAIDTTRDPDLAAAAGRIDVRAAALHDVDPVRAIPFDVLMFEARPDEDARSWLVIDQVDARRCTDARTTLASGPVPSDVRAWALSACPDAEPR